MWESVQSDKPKDVGSKTRGAHLSALAHTNNAVVKGAHAGLSADANAGAGAGAVFDADVSGQAGSSQSGVESTAARATAFDAAVNAAMEQLISGSASGQGIAPLVDEAVRHMDLDAAERAVTLPPSIASVLASVERAKEAGEKQPKDVSFEEGRTAVTELNRMISAAQKRLDSKAIDCKSFKKKNRETYGQVSNDLTRFGQVVADLARGKSKALAGIEELTMSSQQAIEEQEKAEIAYNRTKLANTAQLQKRQSDLDIAQMMLEFTMCDGPGLGMLQGSRVNGTAGTQVTAFAVEACRDAQHGSAITFRDGRLENSTKRLTAYGRQMLDFAMSRTAERSPQVAAALRATGLAMSGRSGEDLEDGDDAEPGPDITAVEHPHKPSRKLQVTPMSSTHRFLGSKYSPNPFVLNGQGAPLRSRSFSERLRDERQRQVNDIIHEDFRAKQVSAGSLFGRAFNPAFNQQAPPVPEAVPAAEPVIDEAKQANKCVSAEADCGLLHDTFANLWGDMRDLVDESVAALRDADVAQRDLDAKVNAQLQAFTTQKGELQSMLAESTSTMSTEVEAQTQKQAQSETLEKVYKNTMRECKATVKQILFTEMCGIVKVRNAIMEEVGMELATDCEVSDWVPGQCSVPCDDKLIGGNMTLTRQIITMNNENGAACPILSMEIPCNQIRCPINCEMGGWSPFSKCTKECGGGVQGRTRQVLQKPKNGGTACDSAQESRPCNTGSCDVNCQLGDWLPFAPCTQACDGGYSERHRDVLVKTVGAGMCPSKNHAERYEKQQCNEEPCIGDEECLAKMDLVIAIDGSGSLTEKGFEIVKTFTEQLVKRFKTNAYGKDAMRVAVVQFGNGRLGPQNVVSDALIVAPLSAEMTQLSSTIQGLSWQRGFTNLAQAMLKSRDVLGASERTSAERAVLIITDGRPTFRSQALTAAHELRDSARVTVLQVKAFPNPDDQKLLQSYTSVPWRSNYIHVPGKKVLKGAMEDYVTKVVAQLCPRAESPSMVHQRAELVGFTLMRQGVNCGPGDASSVEVSLEDCKAFADSLADAVGDAAMEWDSFAYGDGGNCLVYDNPCNDFTRNTTYNVYDMVMTEAQQMLAGPR